MRTRYIIAIFLMLGTLFPLQVLADTTDATRDYYYSGNKKIYLDKDESRVVVAQLKGTATSLQKIRLASGKTLTTVDTIKDERYSLTVVDNSLSALNSRNIALKSSTSESNDSQLMYLPCYTAGNVKMSMTPYLNIKLKSSEDYSLLERVSEEYKLDIISQDEYLPLWYLLSITSETEIFEMTGTSMAAPFVSGIAALLLERNPDLTAKEVRDIILNSAGEEGYRSDRCGYGLVNAYNALMMCNKK